MTDLFNNPSNDYIYPGLSPCPAVSDDQYLTWTENGLSIIKGSSEIANIDFSDLAVPVEAFLKQQKVLGPGEVTFITGLTKGLCNRSQSFLFPSLISTDETLNPYFMQIDLSINYYKNFSYSFSNIDVSSNYTENIGIADALNLQLSNDGIKVVASYDASVLSFEGSQPGYDFVISNVFLTIIDTSDNSSSPFPNGYNAETYDMLEDASAEIPAAKYPNTAMQGLALKGIYPDGYNDSDYWIYLNHVSDYLVMYDASNVNMDPSIYYLKNRRKIEVGMSGCSVGESISAGDYLNWVTVNGYWKKVGEVYIWISASDADDCTTRNLIDGFYVFNPHEFAVKIEYLVIV